MTQSTAKSSASHPPSTNQNEEDSLKPTDMDLPLLESPFHEPCRQNNPDLDKQRQKNTFCAGMVTKRMFWGHFALLLIIMATICIVFGVLMTGQKEESTDDIKQLKREQMRQNEELKKVVLQTISVIDKKVKKLYNVPCLTTQPEDGCKLEVSYPSIGELTCDVTVPEEQEVNLGSAPSLKLPGSEVTSGVVVMFDTDVPGQIGDPSNGFLHWLSHVSASQSGQLTIGQELIRYSPPTPTEGSGDHRYQIYLFMTPAATLQDYFGNPFDFCSFKKNNNLGQPIASFQFRFGRK